MASASESAIIDLKVKELLDEVRVDYSKTKPLDDAVALITRVLLNLSDEQVKPTAAAAFLKDLGVPDDKINFKFKKPDHVEIVGSYAIKTVAKPVENIDLAVRMPKSCFYEKDYLNHRYHAKRCLYLTVIKKHLDSCSEVGQVEWSTFRDDARKPILVVRPGHMENGILTDFVIRIIPTIRTGVFDISKLAPSRNNVRQFQQGGVAQPTPYYNASILEDFFLEEHSAFLQKMLSGSKALGEALLLLKVWTRQRTSINAPDCLNGFIMSIILAYLMTEAGGQCINNLMTELQIFRVVINFLANSDKLDKGIFMQSKSADSVSLEKRKAFLQSFDIVICDSLGYLNLAFRMTKSALAELRDEAAQTLTYMDKCKDKGFEEVFMTRIDFAAKFDYHVRINPKESGHLNLSELCMDRECWRVYEKEVESLLCRALGERARLIRVICRSVPTKWNLDEGLASIGKVPLRVGILISDFEKAFRMVDVGPSADNKEEAAKFRSFWGEKAELRRFKDGTIAESAVWECQNWEKHLIIKKIAEYVLCRHLSLSTQNICIVAEQLDFSLVGCGKDPTASTPKLLEALEVLSKRLRNLEDLPLKISSVQPLDSAFRHTSVYPPVLHPLAREREIAWRSTKLVSTCIQPLEVMIQLEGSGKWPVGEMAIEKTKCAFCLKIAESLQRRWGVMAIATENDVDLLMFGFAFRLRISYEKDKSLVKKQGLSSVASLINAQNGSIVPLEKDLLLRSQHSSTLNGLQGLHPAYGPTVRLAKRWVCSHMFSGVLADEAVELLVAFLFVRPFPFRAPCSRVTGFLRFLRLVSDYDWAMSPLIVDVNGDLTVKDQSQIISQFIAKRKESQGESGVNNGGPAMYIATPYDRESESWTLSFPDSLVLKRLIAFARSSLEQLTRLVEGDVEDRWQSLFRTPLHCYDALILLHRDKLPYPNQMLFPAEINQAPPLVAKSASKDFCPYLSPAVLKHGFVQARNYMLVGFDPVKCFLQDLKAEFPNVFNIWYDAVGSEVVGITWTKEASISLGAGHKRKRDELGLSISDVQNILKEIGDVGAGLVKSVHLLKVPKEKM